MADPREAILNQILYLAENIPGVVLAARNAPDVPGIKRPAMIVHDGEEIFSSAADSERAGQVQLNELRPVVAILVSIDAVALGTQLNTFRALLLSSVINDPVIGSYMLPDGFLRYEGCAVEEIVAESREGRMTVHFTFCYPFRVADLTDAITTDGA
jgi:hypothetical protein